MTQSTAMLLRQLETRLETSLNALGTRFNTIEARLDLLTQAMGRGLSEADTEKAGQLLAEHVITAGEDLLSKLAGFDAVLGKRLGHVLQTLATYQAHLETLPPAAHLPPPDPVRESDLYKQLVGLGIDEDVAYGQAEKKLQAPTPEGAKINTAAAASQAAQLVFEDTPLGRLKRVAELLGEEVTRASITIWNRLEDAENKHSVEGEATAFELLYPAIVVAARANAGKLTLAQFLDEKAIKAGRAPWELESVGTEDAVLSAELNTMLAALERANHPMAQAPPRTTEKEGGRTLTESTKQYHSRVKRVYQQLQHLQQMGV